MLTIEPRTGEAYYLLRDEKDPEGRDISADLPRFHLRGAASENTALPLPGDTASITDLEVDGIERNQRGTVRVFPRGPVMEATVLWHAPFQPDSNPTAIDLKIALKEEEVIRQVVENLGLKKIPTVSGKTQAIRSWFQRDFTYTRYLSVPRRRPNTTALSEINHFLTKSKRGHCEYFATSAALILRAAEVPTRYAVGFGVMEKDSSGSTYLLRGTHAHAWTRVWDADAQRWLDFDPTPPGWFAVDQPEKSSTQAITDRFQQLREDFYLWRNRPSNRLGVGIVMILLAVSFTTFVVWKLWGSKRTLAKKSEIARNQTLLRTPLHELEALAKKHLGPRPPGMPFPQWLRALPLSDPALLQDAIQLHQQLRFDPASSSDSIMERLQDRVRKLENIL